MLLRYGHQVAGSTNLDDLGEGVRDQLGRAVRNDGTG
jgi:hypothetical protein